jgi:hypothetical protein
MGHFSMGVVTQTARIDVPMDVFGVDARRTGWRLRRVGREGPCCGYRRIPVATRTSRGGSRRPDPTLREEVVTVEARDLPIAMAVEQRLLMTAPAAVDDDVELVSFGFVAGSTGSRRSEREVFRVRRRGRLSVRVPRKVAIGAGWFVALAVGGRGKWQVQRGSSEQQESGRRFHSMASTTGKSTVRMMFEGFDRGGVARRA